MKLLWILAFVIFISGVLIVHTAKAGRTTVYDLPFDKDIGSIRSNQELKKGYYDFRLRGKGIAGYVSGELNVKGVGNTGASFHTDYFEFNFTGEEERIYSIETIKISPTGEYQIFLNIAQDLPPSASASLIVSRGYYADLLSYSTFSLIGIAVSLFGFLFLALLIGEHVISSVSIADKSKIQ